MSEIENKNDLNMFLWCEYVYCTGILDAINAELDRIAYETKFESTDD